MKTVRTFSNLAEAGFCSSLLEASAIRAFVADEQSYASGYGAALGPLRVQVGEDDFARAVAVLERGPDAASENAAAKSADFSAQRGLGDRSVPWAIQRDIRPNETGSVIRREIYEHGELREVLLDEDRDGKFGVKIRFDVFGNRAKPMPVDPVK